MIGFSASYIWIPIVPYYVSMVGAAPFLFAGAMVRLSARATGISCLSCTVGSDKLSTPNRSAADGATPALPLAGGLRPAHHAHRPTTRANVQPAPRPAPPIAIFRRSHVRVLEGADPANCRTNWAERFYAAEQRNDAGSSGPAAGGCAPRKPCLTCW